LIQQPKTKPSVGGNSKAFSGCAEILHILRIPAFFGGLNVAEHLQNRFAFVLFYRFCMVSNSFIISKFFVLITAIWIPVILTGFEGLRQQSSPDF
jgi:hypothetical protein